MNTNRLRWAVRRGMLELDLILLPFLENVYPDLNEDEQGLFEQLLTCEDQDLFSWFLERVEPEEPNLQRIVAIIRKNTGLHAKA